MKKINIFVARSCYNRRYFAFACSTEASTCKEAKESFYFARYPKYSRADIKVKFAKEAK